MCTVCHVPGVDASLVRYFVHQAKRAQHGSIIVVLSFTRWILSETDSENCYGVPCVTGAPAAYCSIKQRTHSMTQTLQLCSPWLTACPAVQTVRTVTVCRLPIEPLQLTFLSSKACTAWFKLCDCAHLCSPLLTACSAMQTVRTVTVCRVLVVPRSAYQSIKAAFPLGTRQMLDNLQAHAEAVGETL